ncbi:unnamed protein product [Amoebophrya sp. A120]|nr:unnamed protein product [Amoebophrya sp. A120]|eukprot:GSA120T00007207001.1
MKRSAAVKLFRKELVSRHADLSRSSVEMTFVALVTAFCAVLLTVYPAGIFNIGYRDNGVLSSTSFHIFVQAAASLPVGHDQNPPRQQVVGYSAAPEAVGATGGGRSSTTSRGGPAGSPPPARQSLYLAHHASRVLDLGPDFVHGQQVQMGYFEFFPSTSTGMLTSPSARTAGGGAALHALAEQDRWSDKTETDGQEFLQGPRLPPTRSTSSRSREGGRASSLSRSMIDVSAITAGASPHNPPNEAHHGTRGQVEEELRSTRRRWTGRHVFLQGGRSSAAASRLADDETTGSSRPGAITTGDERLHLQNVDGQQHFRAAMLERLTEGGRIPPKEFLAEHYANQLAKDKKPKIAINLKDIEHHCGILNQFFAYTIAAQFKWNGGPDPKNPRRNKRSPVLTKEVGKEVIRLLLSGYMELNRAHDADDKLLKEEKRLLEKRKRKLLLRKEKMKSTGGTRAGVEEGSSDLFLTSIPQSLAAKKREVEEERRQEEASSLTLIRRPAGASEMDPDGTRTNVDLRNFGYDARDQRVDIWFRIGPKAILSGVLDGPPTLPAGGGRWTSAEYINIGTSSTENDHVEKLPDIVPTDLIFLKTEQSKLKCFPGRAGPTDVGQDEGGKAGSSRGAATTQDAARTAATYELFSPAARKLATAGNYQSAPSVGFLLQRAYGLSQTFHGRLDRHEARKKKSEEDSDDEGDLFENGVREELDKLLEIAVLEMNYLKQPESVGYHSYWSMYGEGRLGAAAGKKLVASAHPGELVEVGQTKMLKNKKNQDEIIVEVQEARPDCAMSSVDELTASTPCVVCDSPAVRSEEGLQGAWQVVDQYALGLEKPTEHADVAMQELPVLPGLQQVEPGPRGPPPAPPSTTTTRREVAQLSQTETLHPGQTVVLHGLKSPTGAKLNGKKGTVVGFDEPSGRWAVKFFDAGEQAGKRFKAENLAGVVPEDFCSSAGSVPPAAPTTPTVPPVAANGSAVHDRHEEQYGNDDDVASAYLWSGVGGKIDTSPLVGTGVTAAADEAAPGRGRRSARTNSPPALLRLPSNPRSHVLSRRQYSGATTGRGAQHDLEPRREDLNYAALRTFLHMDQMDRRSIRDDLAVLLGLHADDDVGIQQELQTSLGALGRPTTPGEGQAPEGGGGGVVFSTAARDQRYWNSLREEMPARQLPELVLP